MSIMPIKLSSVSDAEISAKPPSITPNRHNTHTQTFTNITVFIIYPQLLALSVPALIPVVCRSLYP